MTETSATQEQRHAEVAIHCLRNGESCLQQRNYGRAFAHYLLVLKLQPWRKPEIKDNFTLALKEWAEQLEHAGRIQDLFTCYEQACQLFPECEAMLNNMGAQLFRLGYADEAAGCFRKALRLCPDFLAARHNLDNLRGHLVDRWHFSMLNDQRRNQAYQQAMEEAVEHGYDVVLDIGSGTGLLSMFAVQAGASAVYGCEMSKTMHELSCDIVRANQMDDDIVLIHKKSTDLSIPADLPTRVSLVVTETFDAGLFGEHILSTLSHAWKHLLNNVEGSKAQVIPGGASVYVTAVESKSLRVQNRFMYPGMRYLDLSEVQLLCKSSATPSSAELCNDGFLQSQGGTSGEAANQDLLSDSLKESTEEFEPYTCERLTELPGGYRLLSDTRVAMDINFNDPEMIDSYLQGFQRELTLRVTQPGRLDALAVWFDLHLDDDLTLTSDPKAESCWQQAIFPVHVEGQQYVRRGDELTVQCGCQQDRLQMSCSEITRWRHRTNPETKTPSDAQADLAMAVEQGLVLSNSRNSAGLCSFDLAPQSPIQFGDCDFFGMQDRLRYRGVSFLCSTDLFSLTMQQQQQQQQQYQQQEDNNNTITTSGPSTGSSHHMPLHRLIPRTLPDNGIHSGDSTPPLSQIGVHSETSSVHSEENSPGVHSEENSPGVHSEENSPGVHSEENSPGVHSEENSPDVPSRGSPQHMSGGMHSWESPQPMSHAEETNSHLPGEMNLGRPTPEVIAVPSTVSEVQSSNGHVPSAENGSHPETSNGMPKVSTEQQQQNSSQSPKHHGSNHINSGDSVPIPSPPKRVCNDEPANGLPSGNNTDTAVPIPIVSLPSNAMQQEWDPEITFEFTSAREPLEPQESLAIARVSDPFVVHLERPEIERLNDLEWSDAYCMALTHLKAKLNGEFTVLDLTQGATLVPLQALKLGASRVGIAHRELGKEGLLRHLARANGIETESLQFDMDSVEEGEREWSIVLAELVEPCGMLRQQVLEDLALSRVTCLKPGGLILPSVVRVYGLLIEAPGLDRDSSLLCDECTLGLRVAEYINEFQMMTHVDIDLSSLKYKRLSEPFELFSLDLNEPSNGEIPSFLEQTSHQRITACDFGQVTAVVYWFELGLVESVRLCTLDPTRHWRQAAVMQRRHLDVSTGTELLVRAACKNSCIDVMVKPY